MKILEKTSALAAAKTHIELIGSSKMSCTKIGLQVAKQYSKDGGLSNG